MRDKKRIPKVLEAVKMVWEENPDLRFFQLTDLIRKLVVDGTGKIDVFFVEDDILMKVINEMPRIETPSFWEQKWKFQVVDPDGWNTFSDWHKRITEEEFFKRASDSTCSGNLKAFHDYYSQKKD